MSTYLKRALDERKRQRGAMYDIENDNSAFAFVYNDIVESISYGHLK